MCKGGSRTTTTSQNTSQNTSQSGSPEALDYARRALGYGDALVNNALPAPFRTMADPNTQRNLGYAYDDAASGGTAVRPFLGYGEDANRRAGDDLNTASGYLRRGADTNVQLNPLDIERYYNPYAANAFASLNQNLGVNSARLRSANNAAMGGVGGDRGAVSEALNFQQDQLARGQLASQFYDRAANIASEQQGRQYTADSANRENNFRAAQGFQSNAGSRMNNANAWFNQYNAGQNRAMNAAQSQYNLEQGRRDIDYQNQQTAYQQPYQNANFYANLVKSFLPTLGTQGTMTGTQTGTQEQTTQQDPLSMIAGLAMTGIGLATGNPMMAMGGMGGMGGKGKGTGGGTGYATNPWSPSGAFGGGSGTGWGYANGTNTAQGGWFKRGGRVSTSMPRKAEGGGMSFWDRGEPIREALGSGTFQSRSDDYPLSFPAAVPDSPYQPGNLNERAQPHIDAISAGEYDPQGSISDTTFRGSPAMEASNAGAIPFPRERPEEAGPSNVSPAGGMDVATRSSNPYAPSAPRPLATSNDEYGIELPEEPKYLSYKRPERNWSEFLLRAGLATLAARGDTDSGGVPKGSLSNIGKGALNALDHEDKDREAARKDVEAENNNISLTDAAKRWREQTRVQRQNAIDNAEERRLARESLEEYRRRMTEGRDRDREEKERHNRAEEARKAFVASQRNEQVKMGKPYSDDQITYRAQVRADNWRKDKQKLIESGSLRIPRDQVEAYLDEGWQKAYDETRKAMLEAREQAFSRMRAPAQ